MAAPKASHAGGEGRAAVASGTPAASNGVQSPVSDAKSAPPDCTFDAYGDIVNGCSGGVTWFYKTFLGRDIGCRYCCDEHDLAYEEGGTRKDRRRADRRFRQCIWDSGRKVRAWLFWLAVRLGGWWYWKKA